MSASLTGEEPSLCHCFTEVRNIESASWPASRTHSAKWTAAAAGSTMSVTGNGQALNTKRWSVGAVAEYKIVRRLQTRKYLQQMAGDRDLAHRESELPLLDPEAGRATAVVAADKIDAHADHVGDVQAFLDIADQFVRRSPPGLEVQVACSGRGCRRYPALGVAGCSHIEFARGCAVENPTRKHAVLHQSQPVPGNALGVKRPRAQTARPQRIVDDGDARGKNPGAELLAKEACLASNRGAVDGAGKMSDQRT